MAASDEWQEQHLTPSGWILGSGKYDFEGKEERPTPPDTVLTVRRHVYVGAIGARANVDESRFERSNDKELIRALLEKYGQARFGV
jgi:hypothetical protein